MRRCGRERPLSIDNSALGRLSESTCTDHSSTFAAVLNACHSDAPSSPPSPIRFLDGPRSVSEAPRLRTIDDEFADLVEQVPGFGGLFHDSTGSLTVYLKDPSSAASAYPIIAAFRRRIIRQPSIDGSAMKVRTAQFDFRELLHWYRGSVLPATSNGAGASSYKAVNVSSQAPECFIE